MKIFKICAGLILGLLMLEFVLHVMAHSNRKPGDFIAFFNTVPQILHDFRQKNPKARRENTLFFIGDSTIFGIGSSNPVKYSLPAQFSEIMQKKYPDFYCLNLGHPGMCTEEGLQVMRLLPENSLIIFRAGVSDGWNPPGAFRFFIGPWHFSLRSLKMLSMLQNKLGQSSNQTRIKNVKNELNQILKYKKHQIYALGYPIWPSSIPLYSEDEKLVTIVNLGRLLNDNHLLSNGIFPASYRCEAFHSNDVGYHMEALFLFNFFCEKKAFGLEPAHKLPVKIEPGFIIELQKKYEKHKAYLRSITETERFSPMREYQNIADTMLEIWNLSRLLAEFSPEQNEQYLREHDIAERLRLLIFHDIKLIITYFSKIRIETRNPLSEFRPEKEKCTLYYNIMKVIASPDMKEWQILTEMTEEIEKSFFKIKKYNISHIPELPPLFPLESCPRLFRESGFEPESLSLKEEWGWFFSAPYEYFQNQKISYCHELQN